MEDEQAHRGSCCRGSGTEKLNFTSLASSFHYHKSDGDEVSFTVVAVTQPKSPFNWVWNERLVERSRLQMIFI